MWQYEKKLQYPVRIKTPNAALAKVIISQLGGHNSKKLLYIKQNPVSRPDFLLYIVIRYFHSVHSLSRSRI